MSRKDEAQIFREACDWLIALQEEPDSRELRARFKTWLSAHPEHATAWTEARYTWSLLGEVSPVNSLSPSEKSREISLSPSSADTPHRRSIDVRFRPAAARQTTRQRRRVLGTVAGAVVACLLIVSFPSIQLYLQADYTSSIGEARRLQLEDGSIVHLGADSALDVAYETQARRVRLLYGEAFFEVKPDRHRPFLVTAGQLETVVIGTTFNVHLTPGGASVAVHDGVVKVASPAFSPPFEDHLRAGDWVRMSWDKASVERGTTPPQQVAAWRQGQLVVKDWPISEVVATLRRYHHGLIVLTDDNLGQSKVTGVYNLHDPLGSLRAVASPYAAVVREITPYLVFLSAS